MPTTTIDLKLGGCVNGAPVDLAGQAELDLGAGRLELELTSRATPLHWDPVLGLLGLLDVVRLVAIYGAAGIDRAFLLRRAGHCDDQRREVGHEVISLVVCAQEGGGIGCQGQYFTALTRLAPVEGAQEIVEACPTVVMPLGEDSILLAGAARFETDWGNQYRVSGHTVAEVFEADVIDNALEVGLLKMCLRKDPGESCAVRMRFTSSIEVRRRGLASLPKAL